jgi:hypothetical protein
MIRHPIRSHLRRRVHALEGEDHLDRSVAVQSPCRDEPHVPGGTYEVSRVRCREAFPTAMVNPEAELFAVAPGSEDAIETTGRFAPGDAILPQARGTREDLPRSHGPWALESECPKGRVCAAGR